MRYAAFISREGEQSLADFPDCPGCQTFADSDGIAAAAREALEGWLEAHLVDGQVPPRPAKHTGAPEGNKLTWVPISATLAAALEVRWARAEMGLSQEQFGRLIRVTQQQIAKLEDPDQSPKLDTLERVARALGLELSFEFTPV